MKDTKIDAAWLWQQLTGFKGSLIKAHIIAIIATLILVPVPLLMPIVVDEVLLGKPAGAIDFFNWLLPAAMHNGLGYIAAILLSVIVLRIVGQLLQIWQSRQFTLIGKTITYQLRKQLLAKVARVSIREFENQGSGNVNSHLVTDVETIDSFIGSTLSRLLVGVLTLVGTSIVLLTMHWQLGLFILLMNPVVVYASKLMGAKVKHLKQKENQSFARFQSRLIEVLEGLYQLRASNAQKHYLAKLDKDAQAIKVDADNFAWKSEAASKLSFLLFLLGFELFRAAAMVMVLVSDLTIGEMLAVFAYLWTMLGPVQELLAMQFSWYGAKGAMARINGGFSLSEESAAGTDTKAITDKNQIEVEGLHFAYNQEHKIFDGLNLTINPGEKVALVGASGGGKSTLIHLLLGIYQQQAGSISINGFNTSQIDKQSLRESVAVVLQQPSIFNDSIRSNLCMGEEYSDEQLWQALDIAELKDLVKVLEQGLDAPLGKQGTKLSGGQRQRIAIARMVLTNPKIVILDEATSALDTQTEAKVLANLDAFLQGRTTLIVAHRLSAIERADTIYVLEDGKICQSGQHQSLLNEEGLYKTLYA